MYELLAISGEASLDQKEVYVEAQVEDPYLGDLSNGSFITTLYDPKVYLKVLGKQPRVFKPKMPYITHVAVYQQDGSQLSDTRRIKSFVSFKVELNGASSLSNQVFIPIDSNGIASFTFTPDTSTEHFSVIATFVENDAEHFNSTVIERAIKYQSPSKSYISVTSSTKNPQVGDHMIFLVKVSNSVDRVHYHIVSASRIIFTDVLQMNNKQKTFDVGITKDMAPSAHIVVYFIRYDGELVADSFNFHVDTSSVQNQVNITVNRRKDFTGDTIEILAYASPQSFFGFAALDESIVQLYNGGNILTEVMLYDELYSFDQHANTSVSHTWNSHLGVSTQRLYFPSSSYAFDALTTFSYAGLLVFTDLAIPEFLNKSDLNCKSKEGRLSCLDGLSCYDERTDRCDGSCQCKIDCLDESNCLEKVQVFRPLHERFVPKIQRLYDLHWLWVDGFTLPDGRVQFQTEVSKNIANFVISGFALSRLTGFGVLKTPIKVSTTRQFYIQVEMPSEMRLGEQIGIQVDVFNFQSRRIEGLVILHPSEDYRFVNVESNGIVSSFSPKLTTGQHHVLVIIQPGQSRRINLPIVALKTGTISVSIEAISSANRDKFEGEIEVSYEGVTNTYHTPYLLSLANMPRMISEFEIVTNQTFLLPLQQTWSFVPGSASAQVSVTGDVCGPFFYLDNDNFIEATSYLKLSFAAVEAGIFSFGT